MLYILCNLLLKKKKAKPENPVLEPWLSNNVALT